MTSKIPVPDAISFEQAIEFTQSLMAQMQVAQSDADLEASLTVLLSTDNGARGFFVTYLTDDGALADHPSEAVIRALQSSPAIVPELLVKNLAMSSAMAITHRRNQNEAMAQGSDRVQRRTVDLIQKVQMAEVTDRAAHLRVSAATGGGEYEAFLNRWGYDSEQRQVIEQQMQRLLGQT